MAEAAFLKVSTVLGMQFLKVISNLPWQCWQVVQSGGQTILRAVY